MSTPITDAAQAEADKAEAVLAIGIMRRTARLLELDRAAMMDALEKVEALTEQDLPAHVWSSILTALAAARANFP